MSAKRKRPARKPATPPPAWLRPTPRAMAAQLAAPNPKRKHPT